MRDDAKSPTHLHAVSVVHYVPDPCRRAQLGDFNNAVSTSRREAAGRGQDADHCIRPQASNVLLNGGQGRPQLASDEHVFHDDDLRQGRRLWSALHLVVYKASLRANGQAWCRG